MRKIFVENLKYYRIPKEGDPLTWKPTHHYIEQKLIGNWLMATFLLTMQMNVDKDKVKAAIKAQQDQQIDNASISNCNLLQCEHFFCSLN